MPSPETLSFGCPHCNLRLTVPSALAGVTGPCPGCRQSITAPPLPEPPSVSPVAAGPAPLPDPPPPASPAAMPELPAARGEPVEVEVTPVLPEGPRIRPEPRRIKERSGSAPIAPRHTTADERLRRRESFPSVESVRSGRIPRLTGAAVFCAAASTVIYLLLYFFLPMGPGSVLREASRPLAVPPPGKKIAHNSAAKPAPPPVPLAADRPSEAPANPPPPPEPETKESPAVLADNVLDAFLSAQDSASRVGLVEPAATVQDLDSTLLRGRLPEVGRILPELPQHNPVEESTDYPYRVSFFLENGKNVDYAILVRQRGSQPPKVFLPAFLDLAGGRLAAFTKGPNEREPATFHVILDPLSVCHDESVPAADRKITFKLLPSMFGKEIARAHVSSGSRFARMVGDADSSLRWGVRMRAIVTIQWNRTEDPAKPYLELMDIGSLNWGS